MLFHKWCLSKSCSKIITNVHCISSLYCTAQIKPMFRPYETNLPYLSLLWSALMNPMYRTNDQRICTGIGKLICRSYHSMFSPNESNVQKQWNLCTDVLKPLYRRVETFVQTCWNLCTDVLKPMYRRVETNVPTL